MKTWMIEPILSALEPIKTLADASTGTIRKWIILNLWWSSVSLWLSQLLKSLVYNILIVKNKPIAHLWGGTMGVFCELYELLDPVIIWVRTRNCGCLVTWFCYQLIAKPGNKTAAVPWLDPYANCISDHQLASPIGLNPQMLWVVARCCELWPNVVSCAPQLPVSPDWLWQPLSWQGPVASHTWTGGAYLSPWQCDHVTRGHVTTHLPGG